MPFSSINWYVIILKWLGRVQLFPSCRIYHFDAWQCPVPKSCFPSESGHHLPTLVLVSAAAPFLLATPGNCLCSRWWKGNTRHQGMHLSLLLAHPWRKLEVSAQTEAFLAKLDSAISSTVTADCAYKLGIPLSHCAGSMWTCEKEKKQKYSCKANAARIANVFYLKRSNRSSVCLSCCTCYEVLIHRPECF